MHMSFKGYTCITTIRDRYGRCGEEYKQSTTKVWDLVMKHCTPEAWTPTLYRGKQWNNKLSNQKCQIATLLSGGPGMVECREWSLRIEMPAKNVMFSTQLISKQSNTHTLTLGMIWHLVDTNEAVANMSFLGSSRVMSKDKSHIKSQMYHSEMVIIQVFFMWSLIYL